MDKSSLKITELPALSVASENGFIPIAQVKEENDTYKVTLKKLRESILFENAYSDTASGVANTVSGDTFFVYTDATKEHVQGWVNAGSGATPLLNGEGEQVTYGTYALLNKALKDKGAIVQWVYNGGLSNGGEQTFTVPLTGNISVQEVYVDGLRQFKDVGFELIAGNTLSFKLATPVKENQTVVAICFGSDDVEKVNEAFLATYTGPTGASNIGVTGGGTVQGELDKRVLKTDLASAEIGKGSDILTFTETVTSLIPYLKTVSDVVNGYPISVLRGIPKNLHSKILSGESTTDLSGYINTLAAELSGSGKEKRGVLLLPSGRIPVADSITLYRQLFIEGTGAHSTEIFLLPGANVDLIKSENFDSVTGTGYTTNNTLVPSWMGLKKLRINGNRTNNTAGNGIKIYGPRINFDELLVLQCAENGLYTEYSDSFGSSDWVGQEEGRIGTVISRNNGQDGWRYFGPHNTVANNIICAYNDNWGFFNQTVAGKYDGNITNLENLHTYANSNGNGDKGSYFGSVTSIGYLIIDGDYCEIAATGCQVSKVKGIFLGQSNDGLIISGSRTNIGEMNMSMHSTAVDRNLVTITGSDNKIGHLFGTSEAATGLNDGLNVSGFTNSVKNFTLHNCKNAIKLTGGGNTLEGVIKNPSTTGLVYKIPTDTYAGRNRVDLIINQSAGNYVSGDRPVDQLDNFKIKAFGLGNKTTEAEIQTAAFAIDTTTAQTLTLAHGLLYTPTTKSVSLMFSSSTSSGEGYEMHLVGTDATNIIVYFKMLTAAASGATGRVSVKVKI